MISEEQLQAWEDYAAIQTTATLRVLIAEVRRLREADEQFRGTIERLSVENDRLRRIEEAARRFVTSHYEPSWLGPTPKSLIALRKALDETQSSEGAADG